jgi:hypothetical protein
MTNNNTDQKNNATGPEKVRVFVNGTSQKCDLCQQVKTGFRGDRSKHFLFKYAGYDGLFCSNKCMRIHHGLPKLKGKYEL